MSDETNIQLREHIRTEIKRLSDATYALPTPSAQPGMLYSAAPSAPAIDMSLIRQIQAETATSRDFSQVHRRLPQWFPTLLYPLVRKQGKVNNAIHAALDFIAQALTNLNRSVASQQEQLTAQHALQESTKAELNATQVNLADLTVRTQANQERLEGDIALLRTEIQSLCRSKSNVTSQTQPDARQSAPAPDTNSELFGRFYPFFETHMRGNSASVSERLREYMPTVEAFLKDLKVAASDTRALDIGCGRGEWLKLLKDAGITHTLGVDSNAAMCQLCRDQKLDVLQADALGHLASAPANTYHLVTGFHIVEHLPFPRVIELLVEAYRTLVPGGLCIFETPNPENLLIASQYFYLDPTHQKPLPPDLLIQAANYCGFTKTEIVRRTPFKDLGYIPNAIPERHPDPHVDLILNHFRATCEYAVVCRKPSMTLS